MNGWLSGWTKKRYKEVCKDLCTCFIKRGFSLSDDRGYEALITSDTCMYISSFEKMRKEVIERTSIVCFIDTRGTNAHPDVFDANAGWVLWNHPGADIKGSYFKLNHPISEKGQRLLEALANPECGWFYRADASGFEAIPGSPISYWATQAMRRAFENGTPLGEIAEPKQGMVTRDNSKFMRLWWEVDHARTSTNLRTHEEARSDKSYKWIPCTSGGAYRKWYGNNESVVNWANDGEELIAFSGPHIKNREYYFRESVTWTAISSSVLSTRYAPTGFVPEHAGNCLYGSNLDLKLLQGVCNSSFCLKVMSILSPTLNFNVGDLVKIPIVSDNERLYDVVNLVEECRNLSKSDWDFFELSWEFNQHPLV